MRKPREHDGKKSKWQKVKRRGMTRERQGERGEKGTNQDERYAMKACQGTIESEGHSWRKRQAAARGKEPEKEAADWLSRE